eukprot:TRINITY_DN4172_c0_g1_i1.p1 TRINITY_DN4172_c0_g1~~TRINITY_DN4172_c0_g1_i1.p1  ORF type:complete len:728 (+),score=99.57 TRINITY_DN4172_c0_g1_i1:43-2226(+)
MPIELRVTQEIDLHTPGQKKTDRPSKRTIYVLCSCTHSDRSIFFTGLADGKVLGWKYKIEHNQMFGGLPPMASGSGGGSKSVGSVGNRVFGTQGANPLQGSGVPTVKQVMNMAGGHKGAVTSLLYSLDHKLLISGSSDYTIKVWDISVRESEKPCVQTLIGHGGTVTSMVTFRGHLFTASTDCTLRVWKAEEGRNLLLYPWFTCIQVVKIFGANWVTSMSYSANPHLNETGELYVGDSSGTLTLLKPILDTAGGKYQVTLELMKRYTKSHHLAISQIVHAVKENFVITISSDTTVVVTNSQNGKVFSKIKNPLRVRFTGVHWLADYKEILLTDILGHVYIFSVYGDKCVIDVQLEFGPISSLSPREGNEYVITSMEGVQMFEVTRQSQFHEYTTHQGPIVSLTFIEPTGKKEEIKLLSVSMDNTIRRLDPRDLICLQQLVERESEIISSYYHHNFKVLCTGHENGVVRLWNIETGSITSTNAHSNSVTSLVGSSFKGKEYLTSVGFDGKMAIWDITTQGGIMGSIIPVASFQAHNHEILVVRFNPSNNTFVTAGNQGTIKIWEGRPPFQQLNEMQEHKEAISCMVLDGNFLITGSDDCTIGIWDLFSNMLLRKLSGHTGPIRDMILLPECGHVASCSEDMTIRIWDYSAERVLMAWSFSQDLACLGYWNARKVLWAGCETGAIISFELPEEIFVKEAPPDTPSARSRTSLRRAGSASSDVLSNPGER